MATQAYEFRITSIGDGGVPIFLSIRGVSDDPSEARVFRTADEAQSWLDGQKAEFAIDRRWASWDWSIEFFGADS